MMGNKQSALWRENDGNFLVAREKASLVHYVGGKLYPVAMDPALQGDGYPNGHTRRRRLVVGIRYQIWVVPAAGRAVDPKRRSQRTADRTAPLHDQGR